MSLRAERSGFVLMEAVIALALISLFAIALLQATSAQVRTAAKANVLLVARALAQDRLAAIQLLTYDELTDLPDSLAEGTFPEPFGDFRWSARVEEMEDEYDLFGAEVVVEGRGERFPIRTMVHTPRPVLQMEVPVGGARGGATGLRGGTRGGRRGGAGLPPLPPRGRQGGGG